MNLSPDEAARALAAIDAAEAGSARLQNYRHFAPHLILWGIIWLVANSISDLWPRSAGLAWLGLSLAGGMASFWIGARCHVASGGTAAGWRWGLTFAAIIAFLAAALAILDPLNGRQQNAFISLFWTFLYTVAGLWLGWRLFAIGALSSLLIVLGYFYLAAHFSLYMGIVAGGALIAGGLWLRRA